MKKPLLAAFAAIISLQTGAAFAKSMFPLVGFSGVAALRVGISAIILFFLFKPYTITITGKDALNLAGYGIVLGLMNILIYKSFSYIPLGIAISIEVLGPLGVSILTSRKLLNLVWVLLALSGLVLLPMSSATEALDPRGIFFALAAAICWGLYIVMAKRVAPLGNRSVAIGMLVASFFIIPLGIANAGLILFSPAVLFSGLFIAILSSALPFILERFALNYLPSNVFGVLMSASPAVSAVAGYLVLHEQLSQMQWLGIGFISVACLGCSVVSLHSDTTK